MIQERATGYRVLFKVMVVIGLLITAGALLSTIFGRHSVTLAMSVPVDDVPEESIKVVDWSGGELVLLHRSASMLASLDDEQVSPVAKRYSDDPDGLNEQHRGLQPEYLLIYNYGTAFRCPLELVLPDAADGWSGGLVEICSGVRYDFAGRLLVGQQAQRHLRVPEQQWRNDKIWLPGD